MERTAAEQQAKSQQKLQQKAGRGERITWRQRGEYVAFLIFQGLCRLMPVRVGIGVAQGLAWLMCRVLPAKVTRREVARENLRQAFGETLSEAERERILFGMWVHLFRLLQEIFQMPSRLHLKNSLDLVEITNRETVLRNLLSDRPVIFLSGHYGNWEVAVQILGIFGFRMGVVARRLDNPLLERWFAGFRSRFGHALIDKTGGSNAMVETLERGGCLCMLGDQDAGRQGMFVEFFGKPASTHRGIALLALRYDAVILVGGARRLEKPNREWVWFEQFCEEAIDPRELTSDDPEREILERYHRALERMILRAPEQYFWIHKRWKTQPGEKRRRRSGSKGAAPP